MKLSTREALLLLAAYCTLAFAPVLVAYLGSIPPARDFWVEFAVGLGFVGLAILSLQFVLTGRFRRIGASLGLDLMLQYHRQIGLVGFAFILAHPLILFAADSSYLSFLDPRVNLPRSLALSAVLGAVTLLIVTSLWRVGLRISYELWRTAHAVLAFFVVFIGLVHVLQVGHYVSSWWKQAMWIGATTAAIALLVNTRLIVPMRLRREPYVVTAVREERGTAWTLVLQAREHPGLRFEPGQFVWLTLGASPFSLKQHPFSISSSAEAPATPELTIKALGDFTSSIGAVEVGSTAYVEGPYGAFSPTAQPGVGAAMIVGGVGITPVMSMLRTFRDRNDQRSVILLYGNTTWDDVLFREELAAIQSDINCQVVHVLSEPHAGWDGETGYISTEHLDRFLPKANSGSWEYFVCGPEPMMDLVEHSLRRSGVAATDIFSERFNIV